MSASIGLRSLLPIVTLSAAALLAAVCVTGAIWSLNTHEHLRGRSLAQEQAYARLELLAADPQQPSARVVPQEAAVAPRQVSSPSRPVDTPATEPKRAAPTPILDNRARVDKTNAGISRKNPARDRLGSPPAMASRVDDQVPAPITSPPNSTDAASERLVSAEAVERAKKSNKIEGVAGAKLGVAKVNVRDVSLLSGGSIRIGERFPSGERLLALDPENGQIITDKRTLLVF